MTPRERVLAAMQFEEADLPFSWGFGPNKAARRFLQTTFAGMGLAWDRFQQETEDVLFLLSDYLATIPANSPAYMGIWGIQTRSVDYGSGTYDDEIAHHPLAGADDPAALEDYPWPSPSDYDYASLEREISQRDPGGTRAIRLNGGNPFEIYSWMTGLEEAMMNLIAEPDFVMAAMARINQFFKERYTLEAQAIQALGRNVDLVLIGDDLGTQTGPLVSPSHYRSIIKPFHRELCDHIRATTPGAYIEYHTDGSVFDFIPDLMDAGVQVLEAVQVECARMEPERLADSFGRNLRFQGAISVQGLLPRATPSEVCAECRRLVATLGQGGGYLPAPSHAVQTGTPVENLLAMLETICGPERLQAARAAAKIPPPTA